VQPPRPNKPNINNMPGPAVSGCSIGVAAVA
jgi:hypothetical protein